MSALFRLPESIRRDAQIDRWLGQRPGELGFLAERWFGVMRNCGDDVRECLHDGHPTACVGDAAFGYVNVFTSHLNVGFFRGAALSDPEGLLVGSGKWMRHVKVGPGRDVDSEALARLVRAAYAEIKTRLALEGDFE